LRRFETHDPNFVGLSELAWKIGGREQCAGPGGGECGLLSKVAASCLEAWKLPGAAKSKAQISYYRSKVQRNGRQKEHLKWEI
jgi:hypothetical protein